MLYREFFSSVHGLTVDGYVAATTKRIAAHGEADDLRFAEFPC